MSSFNGTISYEGKLPHDTEVQEAIRLANSTRAMKEATGLPRVTKAYDLADGGQAYVLDMEHTWRVHIVSPFPVEEGLSDLVNPATNTGTPRLTIAGFVSGAAFGTTIENKEVSWPDVGQEDQEMAGVPSGDVPTIVNDAFGLVKESSDLFPKDQASYKLAVPLDTIFSTVGDMEVRNQFRRVVPGQYTGAMAPIVQLLLGVGKVVFPDYEARWLGAGGDEERTGLYADQIDDLRYGFSYGEYGVTQETGEVVESSGLVTKEGNSIPNSLFFERGGQIQIDYDYRWNRTHGIMWGQGNDGTTKPMLVELAQRGIHVMEFPVDEISKSIKVQEHYEKVYPKLKAYKPFQGRSKTLFEAFGGFPTGENFPGFHEEFDRWKRAGAVIESPQDLSKFYAGGMTMTTAFGWAFHPTQSKAINTAYKFEQGHKVGYCHQVLLEIKEKTEAAKTRNPFLDATVAALGLTERIDLFKAVRLPEHFAEQMIQSPDYDAFDAFDVEPDWTVSANVIETGEGIIDYPGNQCPGMTAWVAPFWFTDRFFGPRGGGGNASPCDIIASPHFKYYEPLLGEVLNFDFSNATFQGERYVSDGPIFATYREQGVEILNYYHEPNEFQVDQKIDTRQKCQFVGSWESGSRTTGTKPVGYFYCTSKDFRKRINYESGSHTVTTGKRIGNADFIAFCHIFARHSTSKKIFFGTEQWKTEGWEWQSYFASATCAANNRSAFLICWEKQKGGRTDSEGFSGAKNIGASGGVRHGVIYNFVWHWRGCADWECSSQTSPCVHHICESVIEDPDSCHGTEFPSIIDYSVCPPWFFAGTEIVVNSPVNAVIQSTLYTQPPQAPPAWRRDSEGTTREFEWEVWAFGLDLLNNRRVNKGKEVFDEGDDLESIPRRSSYTGWWRCSIPGECPAPQWLVSQNFFGKPFVSAYDDLDPSEIVDFGAELSVGFGPSSVPFGILD